MKLSFLLILVVLGTLDAATLINHWPLSGTKELIKGSDLSGGSSYSLVSNRLNQPNSATYFNKGFLEVPKDVYFKGDFSTTIWVNFKVLATNVRVFDFGNGQMNDNVILSIQDKNKIGVSIKQGTTANFVWINSAQILNTNQWYHIGVVLQGTIVTIYIDGVVSASGKIVTPKNVVRSKNYIAKSNWAVDPKTDAIFSDFKIYDGALTNDEINNDFKTADIPATTTTNNIPATSTTTKTPTTTTTTNIPTTSTSNRIPTTSTSTRIPTTLTTTRIPTTRTTTRIPTTKTTTNIPTTRTTTTVTTTVSFTTTFQTTIQNYSCLPKENRNINNVKSYNDYRLYGHYADSHQSSIEECWQSCVNDQKCIAITFSTTWFQNCFLFDCSDFTKGNFTGWKTYSLMSFSPNYYSCLPDGNKNVNNVMSYNDYRLYGHYADSHQSSIEECWQNCVNDQKCIAITFSTTWFQNCFLFDCSDFSKGNFTGWKTYSLIKF